MHYDCSNVSCTIMFLTDQDDSDGDSSSDDEDEDGTGEEKVIAEFCQVSNIASAGALGDWERHTKVGW